MWIDTHCHPFSADFKPDKAEMLERAYSAGVSKMLVVGFGHTSNRAALQEAQENPRAWATVGVHPCDVAELTDEEFEWMRKTLQDSPRVVAVGETGLDYHHMKFPEAEQAEAFRKQIRLAKELDLPCIVHSRDAAEDTLRILLEEETEKAVFHCYTYDLAFARKVWEAGYFTSFSAVVTYPSAKDIQEAARQAPADLILLETDCPYLAPQSHRGQRNEIAWVAEVGAFVAKLRGVSAEILAEQSTQNAVRLFKLL